MCVCRAASVGLSTAAWSTMSEAAALLRQGLDEGGVNQKWLAQNTGYSEKHVSFIMTGKAPVSPLFAVLVESHLDVDAMELAQASTRDQVRALRASQGGQT